MDRTNIFVFVQGQMKKNQREFFLQYLDTRIFSVKGMKIQSFRGRNDKRVDLDALFGANIVWDNSLEFQIVPIKLVQTF